MKKADYADLTRLGVRARLQQLERYLADMHAEFPEEFAAPTAPVFVKAEIKSGGNTWPPFIASSNGIEEPSRQRAGWTPERRQAQAERMRGNRNKKKSSPTSAWGNTLWHHMHDYLMKQPNHTARVMDMHRALKAPDTTIESAIRRHGDRFKKRGKGTYQLVKPISAAERDKLAHVAIPVKKQKRTPEVGWGVFHWQKIHDYLLTKDERTAPLRDIMKELHIPSQASAITSMQGHKNLFRRTEPGVYQLHTELPPDQRV